MARKEIEGFEDEKASIRPPRKQITLDKELMIAVHKANTAGTVGSVLEENGAAGEKGDSAGHDGSAGKDSPIDNDETGKDEKREQMPPEEILLEIPIGGDEWKKISAETGLKTTMEMRRRLIEVAKEEGYNIIFEFDKKMMRDLVRLVPKNGIRPGPVSRKNHAFLSLFKKIG